MSWKEPSILPKDHPLGPWIILINISLATLLAIISSMSAGIASTTIAGALIIDTSANVWVFTSYLMAIGSCLPLSVWLAERFGYKCIFFAGFTIFVIGSAGAGFAYDFNSLIFFRIVEGIGGGLIFPISLTIISKEFPQNLLSTAISLYMGLGFGLGVVIGFLIGGYLGQDSYWRWIFLINPVLAIPVFLLIFGFHHETESKPLPLFDFLGYGLFILFLLPLLLIVNSAKQPWNTEGWTSNYILTCFALCLIGLIGFLIVESKVKNPVIVLKLFKDIRFLLSCMGIAIMGVIFFATASLIPNYLENQLLYEKWNAGLMMITLGVTFGIIGSIGGLFAKILDLRILCLIGLGVLIASCFLNQTLTLYSDQKQIALFLISVGIGVGVSIGPVTTIGLSNIPKEYLGIGTVIITFARQIGGAFGSSVMGLIVAARIPYHNQIFGNSVDFYSPQFQKVVKSVSTHIMSLKGATDKISVKTAHGLVMKDALAQSAIASMNDAYYLIGWISLILTVVIALAMLHGFLRKRREEKT